MDDFMKEYLGGNAEDDTDSDADTDPDADDGTVSGEVDDSEDGLLGDLGVLEDDAAAAKAEQDKLDAQFKKDYESAQRLSDDWVEPHVDTGVEQAAVKAAANIAEFSAMLRAANDKQAAEFELMRKGYEPSTGETFEPEISVDISTLSQKEFASFATAVASGYSDRDWLAQQKVSDR